MFPLYRNQSADFSANQLTGFYMMGTLVVKGLTLTTNIGCQKNENFFGTDVFSIGNF